MDEELPETGPDYFIGLDLGQAAEYTALAVLERTAQQIPPESGEWAWHYAVRHLQRFPLGTPYGQVLLTLKELTRDPALSESTLVMDQTSVGVPVVRLFRQADLQIALRPVTIVVGHEGGHHDGLYSIPKRELASVLQLTLQGRRLKVSDQLEHAQTLLNELQSFRVKVPAVLDVTSAWREREHDDLVFAVGVAVWMAERRGAPAPPDESPFGVGGSLSIMDDAWGWETHTGF
jgi:hypothetical protein